MNILSLFKSLLSAVNMKPAGARSCEFCGGIKCMGLCGTVETPAEQLTFTGLLTLETPTVGCITCPDGVRYHFNREGQAGRALLQSAQENNLCQITAVTRKNVIKTVLNVTILHQ